MDEGAVADASGGCSLDTDVGTGNEIFFRITVNAIKCFKVVAEEDSLLGSECTGMRRVVDDSFILKTGNERVV